MRMRGYIWLLRFLIPIVVLFMIGYLVPGFSALTFSWVVFLAILIVLGNWLFGMASLGKASRFGAFLVNFLIGLVVIYTVTFTIQGGHVPLAAAILAALIIAGLDNWILPSITKKV